MSETNFQPIFDYIDKSQREQKQEIIQELSEGLPSKADINKLQNSVDAIALGLKNNDDRVKVVQTKAEGVEKWVMKAADKVSCFTTLRVPKYKQSGIIKPGCFCLYAQTCLTLN